MSVKELRIIGIAGIPEITKGANLGKLIAHSVRASGLEIQDKDIFVVAQKVVSKAEGQVVQLKSVEPSAFACRWADTHGTDARLIEVILSESQRLVRMERGVMITETRHGFICANAGVDNSNIGKDEVTLLPTDPDGSAGMIRGLLEKEFGVQLAIIVSDSFGRPWREGQINVALGVSGMGPFIDYRGQSDQQERQLQVSLIAVADELASAAELVMGKTTGVPVALVRGFSYSEEKGYGLQLLRSSKRDLFR